MLRFATRSRLATTIWIVSHTISLLAALSICILSSFEHYRSFRPSTLITLYLVVCLGASIVQTMTIPSHYHSTEDMLVIGSQICVEMALLVCESRSKELITKSLTRKVTPEEMSGILGRAFFWWINPVLRKGNGSILKPEDMPVLDENLSSEKLRGKAVLAWNQRGKNAP